MTIADGTVGIANYAFYNCKFIGGVTNPDSERSIGRGAFYNCRTLASATLPAGLTVLEDYTFYHCDALTLPTLPATLTGSKGEVIKVARWKVTELTAPAAPASL